MNKTSNIFPFKYKSRDVSTLPKTNLGLVKNREKTFNGNVEYFDDTRIFMSDRAYFQGFKREFVKSTFYV